MIDVFAVVVTDGEAVSLMHRGDGTPLLFADMPPAVVGMVDAMRAEHPGTQYTICKLVPVDANPAMH